MNNRNVNTYGGVGEGLLQGKTTDIGGRVGERAV